MNEYKDADRFSNFSFLLYLSRSLFFLFFFSSLFEQRRGCSSFSFIVGTGAIDTPSTPRAYIATAFLCSARSCSALLQCRHHGRRAN